MFFSITQIDFSVILIYSSMKVHIIHIFLPNSIFISDIFAMMIWTFSMISLNSFEFLVNH